MEAEPEWHSAVRAASGAGKSPWEREGGTPQRGGG